MNDCTLTVRQTDGQVAVVSLTRADAYRLAEDIFWILQQEGRLGFSEATGSLSVEATT